MFPLASSLHRLLAPCNAYIHAHIPSILLHPLSTSFHTHTQSNKKNKKSVVFLGTPKDAADMLEALLDASKTEASLFEVAGVVTQPQSCSHLGRKPALSHVAQRALDKGFPSTSLFFPLKAGEESFLSSLKALQPDLCITAAYGNILPQRFLDIPTYGTVNVHPSLLPLYRGASPVQRAIQDGVKVTGVTLAYTVQSLDSGPIIVQEGVEVNSCTKAPELQSLLFEKGTNLLFNELPAILDGSAIKKSTEQEHSLACLAPKISAEESWVSFDKPALVIHNRVRAFSGWPGTKALFHLKNVRGDIQKVVLKIITTRARPYDAGVFDNDLVVLLKENSLLVGCGDNSVLEILELQPPGKKVMSGRDFWNGLQGRQLMKVRS